MFDNTAYPELIYAAVAQQVKAMQREQRVHKARRTRREGRQHWWALRRRAA
jgi:hypothetical protein